MIKASDLTLSEYVAKENNRKAIWTQCLLIELERSLKEEGKTTLNTPERK